MKQHFAKGIRAMEAIDREQRRHLDGPRRHSSGVKSAGNGVRGSVLDWRRERDPYQSATY